MMHLCAIVAKIFYCGGPSGRLGVLRAVMPFSDLKPLMSGESRDYVASSFPELSHNTSAHTVTEIEQEEEDVTWKAGFYLFEKTPLPFEDFLRTFCKVTPTGQSEASSVASVDTFQPCRDRGADFVRHIILRIWMSPLFSGYRIVESDATDRLPDGNYELLVNRERTRFSRDAGRFLSRPY